MTTMTIYIDKYHLATILISFITLILFNITCIGQSVTLKIQEPVVIKKSTGAVKIRVTNHSEKKIILYNAKNLFPSHAPLNTFMEGATGWRALFYIYLDEKRCALNAWHPRKENFDFFDDYCMDMNIRRIVNESIILKPFESKVYKDKICTDNLKAGSYKMLIYYLSKVPDSRILTEEIQQIVEEKLEVQMFTGSILSNQVEMVIK